MKSIDLHVRFFDLIPHHPHPMLDHAPDATYSHCPTQAGELAGLQLTPPQWEK